MKIEFDWFFDIGDDVFIYGWKHRNAIVKVKLVRLFVEEFNKKFGQFKLRGVLENECGEQEERYIEDIHISHRKALDSVSGIFDKCIYDARKGILVDAFRTYEHADKQMKIDVDGYRQQKKLLKKEYKEKCKGNKYVI